MIALLIQLVVAGLIAYAVWWFIGYVGLPEPFNKIARVIVGLVVLVYLLHLLAGLAGMKVW